MKQRREALRAVAAFLIAIGTANSGAYAESFARRVPTSGSGPSATSVVLQTMTNAAGVIFAGQVVSIHRPTQFSGPDESGASGTVEVVFRVNQALRGCTSGSVYILREWSGLWTGGTERYRVGQQLLMFLRNSDGSGLSSTVHGAEGAIPLRGGGAAPGPDDSNPEAAEWLVDLRWVQAQAPRNNLFRLKSIRRPIRLEESGALEMDGEARTTEHQNLLLRDDVLPWTVPSRPAESEMVPLSQILNLCRGFMRQSDDAR